MTLKKLASAESKIKIHLAVFYLFFGLSSCGARIEETIDSTTPRSSSGFNSDDLKNEPSRCKLSEPSDDLKKVGFKKIDINQLSLESKDGSKKTLCDALLDIDANVMVVQFSGVTCLSCQEEGIHFTKALALSKVYGNQIAHSVALTDFYEDYTEEEFERFMTQYAPHSLRLHDPSIALWKYFSKDPLSPTRPTLVAYSREGWSYLINEEGQDIDQITKAANSLLTRVAPSSLNNSRKPTDPAPVIPPPSVIPPADEKPVVPTPPAPGQGLSLTATQNIDLKDGNGKSEKLSDYFGKNQYLVIDLSQFYCTYCKQLANKHQTDSAFQSRMSSNKCRMLTMVPNQDVASWVNAYPMSTFVGQQSRGVANLGSVASAFKVSFSGTPTAFIIDRNGKVVASQVGATPAIESQICK